MSYTKQTWDTTSYVNPTRMNYIENGIKESSDRLDNLSASDVAYDSNTTVKQKLDELESLPSSVRAWSGDTLKFSIPQSNGVIYKFIAMNPASELVEACLINRTDGLKVAHTSALTMSATYANGELTVTLPSPSYWVYSLTAIKSRY